MAESTERVQIYFSKCDGNVGTRQFPSNSPPHKHIHSTSRKFQQPNSVKVDPGRSDRSDGELSDQVEVYSTDFTKPVRPTIRRLHMNPNEFDAERVLRSNPEVYDEWATVGDGAEELPQHWTSSVQSKVLIAYAISCPSSAPSTRTQQK